MLVGGSIGGIGGASLGAAVAPAAAAPLAAGSTSLAASPALAGAAAPGLGGAGLAGAASLGVPLTPAATIPVMGAAPTALAASSAPTIGGTISGGLATAGQSMIDNPIIWGTGGLAAGAMALPGGENEDNNYKASKWKTEDPSWIKNSSKSTSKAVDDERRRRLFIGGVDKYNYTGGVGRSYFT